MQSLRQYQSFDSIQELNEMESYVLSNVKINEPQRDLYILLCRHSIKFPGVSYLKVESMANRLKTSTRTVRRHLKSLQDLGVIKRIKQIRIKSGGFGASLTIICPIDLSHRQEPDISCDTYNLCPIESEETINYKTTKQKILNKRMDETVLDHTFVPSYIPKEFIKAVKPFFNDAKKIVKLWQSASICFNKHAGLSYGIPESGISIVIYAFKQAIYKKYKNSKRNVKTDIGGYFYGVLRKMISDYMKQMQPKQIIPLLYSYWE